MLRWRSGVLAPSATEIRYVAFATGCAVCRCSIMSTERSFCQTSRGEFTTQQLRGDGGVPFRVNWRRMNVTDSLTSANAITIQPLPALRYLVPQRRPAFQQFTRRSRRFADDGAALAGRTPPKCGAATYAPAYRGAREPERQRTSRCQRTRRRCVRLRSIRDVASDCRKAPNRRILEHPQRYMSEPIVS